jgi:tRNA1(Val) A37 N6-methylase TrmN6
VLDIGCGAGAAALCLAARVVGARITGVEKQRELVRLAGDNAALNGVADRFVAVLGDLDAPPPRLAPGSFAHVMANPPFLEAGAATPPPDPGKRAAHVEGDADLAAWIRFALLMARPKGTLTFIHRADRLEHLLAALAGRAGEIVVFPLWPGEAKPAKRVLVRARKSVATPTRLAPGLILHRPDGRFTDAAEAVLRHAAALEL